MILITIIVGCMTSINRSHVYNDTSTTHEYRYAMPVAEGEGLS